jgi:hypothetical protein
MSTIAAELDKRLKSLDPEAAASLERLVRDALELVKGQNGGHQPCRLPSGFFSQIAREFGKEPFERPPQGESEKRSDW